MPERELSKALNVSRTSVRNAISKLVVIGLLEYRQGQGTFVRLRGGPGCPTGCSGRHTVYGKKP